MQTPFPLRWPSSGILFLALLAWLLPTEASFSAVGGRLLLKRVVEACVLNHKLTGLSFPCLEVHSAAAPGGGFIVLRVPGEATHIVVSPTKPIRGIEDLDIHDENAPNLFEKAWEATRYVAEGASGALQRDALGLAINSAQSRTQDHLHIHADCLRPDVKNALDKVGAPEDWTSVSLLGTRYELLVLRRDNLKGLNAFRIAAARLKLAPGDLGRMTIAVMGALLPKGQQGFYLLARAGTAKAPAASEGLLDHSCAIASAKAQ